ncbi:pericentriolar material 1 protein [Bombina bombina]|uniref:pericentriolar material 1 protein n=1 Tax=Bombina bombina TaxID=8345 RepID=UPI00235AEAFF|nr:pericentriolar material 1 protein [Bombina bombina]
MNVVSRLVQIRDYITKAKSLRDDLVEKNERSANVERLSNLIDHLKAQEKSYLKFLQKMLAADPQQKAKEELKNMKKQHALLTRMLQQQEQLRALKGRQAALLALQQKAEQAIARMDESVVTETTGSVSGLSFTSELNEELNDLIQRFHNQLHDSQTQTVPNNRRQAESLSLAREVSQSRNSSLSEAVSEEKDTLLSKVGVLLEKKQKMDSFLELHTLHDHTLNNTANSPQRSISSAASVPLSLENRAAGSSVAAVAYPSNSVTPLNETDDEDNQNPVEKVKKLKEVRKRLNELRDLVHYYEQTSDMMTDAVNENTKDEEETEDSEYESEQEATQPATNIRNPQHISSWAQMNSITNAHCGTNNRDERPLNTECEVNNRSSVNLRSFNVSSALDCLYNREDKEEDCDLAQDEDNADEDHTSRGSLSSRSSVADDVQNADFEQKYNRLIAAKEKLRQLQELVAMYGDDTESETVAADRSGLGDHLLAEVANHQPNNTRLNAPKSQKDIVLKEQARERFYESKLQQQQKELKHLQEERKKLIEIQEEIKTLQKACPDLQLSTSSVGGLVINGQMTATTSTPGMSLTNKAEAPALPDPEDSSSIDNEVWSEIRRHKILREDLRQRRKQLENLMAEHQRRQGLAETVSGASLRSDDSVTHGLNQHSRTENYLFLQLTKHGLEVLHSLLYVIFRGEMTDIFLCNEALMPSHRLRAMDLCCGRYRFRAASVSSAGEPKESKSKHAQTEDLLTGNTHTTSCDHLERMRKDNPTVDISSEAGSEFAMFEALRDTIYSEVATLISQNEARPHFLIELFHELQLLNTDYLRQKALFSLQDIVTRRITENSQKREKSTKVGELAGWMASNSEFTPSESLATTDDEMFAKNLEDPVCPEGEQNDGDNVSTMSTSSNFEPFATDDLGNTVIHLDQALARMREYERMKTEAENSLGAESCNNPNNAATNVEESQNDSESRQAPLSGGDGPGVPCPRIDTQQLDRQIKAIMKEVIPFLKEHMEEVCSPHLLTSIRKMVLTLTQQNDESKEFVKFFHKQLGSILQDSLAKFSSKKLKDCGEDLLVEISEVLFNELAFFRLMQDLDNNSTGIQGRCLKKSEAAGALQSFTKEAQKIFKDGVYSATREVDDEDKDKDETETIKNTQENKNNAPCEDQSGRSDASDEDDGDESLPVSISLSKAETQALTNYGSGEDENEEEENYEFEAGLADVQTSLEANSETADETEQIQRDDLETAVTSETSEACPSTEKVEELTLPEEQVNTESVPPTFPLTENSDKASSATVAADDKSPIASPHSSEFGSPATESPVLVNEFETGSGNLSQKSDEDDFVKVEDLSLTMSKADLIKEIAKEEGKNNLSDEILNLHGEENSAVELAGDPLLLKEPDMFGAHSA